MRLSKQAIEVMFGILLLLLMFDIVILLLLLFIYLFEMDYSIVWSTFCWTLSANNGQLQAKFLVGVTKVFKWKIARL